MANQVKQVLGATSNAELYAIRFAFGENRDALSQVAVLLQRQFGLPAGGFAGSGRS